ncbi:MAG: nucleotide disphospho-sugar-binding domain-containing protein [Sciscionella sp.]
MSTRKFFAARAGAFPMSELLDMASSLDIELVATLNPAQLASVSRVPGNVRVVDYLPLNQLLPTCSVIIHHGGGGTFAAAVAEKVPQLITPGMGADRVETATYVADRGAGLLGPYLDGADFSVDLLKRQLGRLLDEPSFKDGAAELYDEMTATPSPNDAVPELERLTARHRSRPAVLSGT